jgi:excisionase family DNA binding protein
MHTQHESTDLGGLGAVRIDQTSCATVSLAQAAQILGVHRSTAWDLYRRGEFPLPVLRIGTRLRVSKVHLERFLLGVDGAA